MKKRNFVLKYVSILLLIGIIFSCDLNEKSQRLLVKASGTPGEIILVIDSVQWQGELGDVLRETLLKDLPGVSRPETIFTIRYIEPTLFNSVLNKAKNLIFVATLDSKTKGGEIVRNYMTNNYIQDNPDKFIISQKDIFASGQEVLYLFSATTDELIERVRNNKETIRNFFNQKENNRLLQSLYKAKEEKAVNNYLASHYGYSLRVPNGYRIEAKDSSFMWLRSVGQIDKNIFITYLDYKTDEIFTNKNLVALRDSITHVNVFEDPADEDSYIRVDTVHIATEFTTTKFNGQYAKRIRGIWKANNLTLGGSFISYIFVYPNTNRLYFLDGFVVSPGKKKRETLRELEVILKTFKTIKEDIAKQST